MGKTFFKIVATFAEFDVDLLEMRTREAMAVGRVKGKLLGKHDDPAQIQWRVAVHRDLTTWVTV